MGDTKNITIIKFLKVKLEGKWNTSFSNPDGAITYDNDEATANIRITPQNGDVDKKYKINPRDKVRIFNDVIHFSEKD